MAASGRGWMRARLPFWRAGRRFRFGLEPFRCFPRGAGASLAPATAVAPARALRGRIRRVTGASWREGNQSCWMPGSLAPVMPAAFGYCKLQVCNGKKFMRPGVDRAYRPDVESSLPKSGKAGRKGNGSFTRPFQRGALGSLLGCRSSHGEAVDHGGESIVLPRGRRLDSLRS